MEPVYPGGIAVIRPHQHGRRLPPGGEGGGLEQGLTRPLIHDAVGHADGGGHGDVAGVLRHVGEGSPRGGQAVGQRFIAQGPHQHHRHVRAGNVAHGVEGRVRVQHPVGTGGLHGGVVPRVGRDVGEGGYGGGYHLPAEHALEDGHKGRPVQRLLGAEGAVLQTLDQTAVRRLDHVVMGPVLQRDVRELHRQGRGGQQAEQNGADHQRGNLTLKHDKKDLQTEHTKGRILSQPLL